MFVPQIMKPPSVLTSPVTSSCKVRSGWPRSMLFLISSFPVPGPDNESQNHFNTQTHTDVWSLTFLVAPKGLFVWSPRVIFTLNSPNIQQQLFKVLQTLSFTSDAAASMTLKITEWTNESSFNVTETVLAGKLLQCKNTSWGCFQHINTSSWPFLSHLASSVCD